MCFEVLGVDVMLDHKLKPYVLEFNHSPSFTTDSPLDYTVKKHVVYDTLMLMNVGKVYKGATEAVVVGPRQPIGIKTQLMDMRKEA
jgi:hypothetical protein